jgi:Tfp pilus assembly protein PilO
MSRFSPSSVLWIDLCGACITVALAATLLWMFLASDNDAGREIETLRHDVQEAHGHLTSLRTTLDQQSALVTIREQELERTGQLPDRAPIERDLKTLYTLASKHGLKVLRVSPLPTREYPELQELRYAFEVTGDTSGLIAFFRSIEEAECWADISYLKVDSAKTPEGSVGGTRTASLTISLFSSMPDEEDSQNG